MIKRGGNIVGFDTVFAGNIPLGAGLSSSAALESTFAFALNEMLNLNFDKFELAQIGQSTEHNYVGVKCGIMDQFASLFGKAGNLIRLDTKDMTYDYFPFNPEKYGYKLVLINTMVAHELASSAYNKRRESCENAAQTISKNHPEVKFLRDASMEMLDQVKNEISQEDYIRAQYVIEETERVIQVSKLLEENNYELVGMKMYETHHGLSKLYEVSCEELDYLNDLAKEHGVTGSRVMGGGFGGCTINLVKTDLCESFVEKAKTAYFEKFNIVPEVYDVVISDGARRL